MYLYAEIIRGKGPVIIYRLGVVGGFWAKHDEI